MDVRDFVRVCKHPDDIKDALSRFAPSVLEAALDGVSKPVPAQSGLLKSLNIGASSAENEMSELGNYYVEIDAYLRAKRKEVRLITGRKGSGKTAIFFQLRDSVRQDKKNVVLDLKPDGYQLRKFKDAVLSTMQAGTVEHTLTAFWEYLLLLEICYKLLEKDKELHKRDHNLFEPYQQLKELYEVTEYQREGDFAERLASLLGSIADDFTARYADSKGQISIDADQLTALLYRHDVAELREKVQKYLHFKSELWLLFDNLDKGWATNGVGADDLVIVRTLIEATRKIERELRQRRLDAHTVVFLRNDIYELLLAETSDRGKETRANVDWTDPESLTELVRMRIAFNRGADSLQPIESLWRQICRPIVDGCESLR